MEVEAAGRERVMVDVWDWETRVLHWANALLIITLALLMLSNMALKWLGVPHDFRESINILHAKVGYLLVATFTLRILWAFVGNKYARWGDMIPYTREKWAAIGQTVRWYLGGFRGSPAPAKGHDQLASLFYIALFVVLASQAVTGLLLAGTEFDMFPGTLFTAGMAEPALKALAHEAEEFHEFGLYFIFFFFLSAHLVGLVVHEIGEKKGLLSSMVHGRKYFPRDDNR